MTVSNHPIHIIGAGLAGSECAFQLAERGHKVHLHEMKAIKKSPAHKSLDFAELVCSNSFGSHTDYSAPGQLKWEAEQLGSLILKAAKESAVPAGMSLSVDREVFAASITATLKNHPNIICSDECVTDYKKLSGIKVIATGPLTEENLAKQLQEHFGLGSLYFYDAIAPVIETDSINMDICWKADRWDKGNKDYINCPLNKEQYYELIQSIKAARKIESKEFEKTPYFENCMPIEEIVTRGDETLRFGPLSFKGLKHPETGRNCYAVVQLRQDNLQATAYNMVGFQTKMAYSDQKEVFRKIPGLEEASFVKLGSIHRNMYINSPKLLNKNLSSKKDENLFFAGQITGVEGYFDSTCVGLMVAIAIDQKINNQETCLPPRASAMGSLLNFLQEERENFQPMNINFSLLPKLEETLTEKVKKSERKKWRKTEQLNIAKNDFLNWHKALN